MIMSASPRLEGGGSAAPDSILDITDLSVTMNSAGRDIRIVDELSLRIAPGERVALVGESGSGKSVTARAIMRLDDSATLTGSVKLDGQELVGLPEKRMRALRGAQFSMVFQDPLRTLNPLRTIGDQIAEPLRIRGVSKRDALKAAEETLDSLGVVDAKARMRAYPFEFSGGMRQRVALAIALIARPKVLIADEPTTALDTRVQERVLRLIDDAARERGVAVLLITHDLGVVAGFADRVAVMYSGRKVEDAPVDVLYSSPSHPYTEGLLAAVPRLDEDQAELVAMPGASAAPGSRPSGCAFHPRCPFAMEICRATLPLLSERPDRAGQVACHLRTMEETA